MNAKKRKKKERKKKVTNLNFDFQKLKKTYKKQYTDNLHNTEFKAHTLFELDFIFKTSK